MGFAVPFVLLVSFFTVLASAFLNIDELNEMKYGIEIFSEPVIKGQSKSNDVVMVSSKYRQEYECRLPAQAVKFHQVVDEDSESYSGQEISDLLRPMSPAPCLVKTKDWWTYEFCYGKHVKQYHLEDSEVKGDTIYLGYYESEFDWNNETAKASKQHRLKRYHSQAYSNGSKCDLNGRAREAEVRFMCEEGSGDYIARVDEPQSCSYVVTVHTTRICHHPYLRPPSATKPQPIKCYPALSPEQYVEYVHMQVSDTKRKVEQISEELKTLDEMLVKDQNLGGDSQPFATQEQSITEAHNGDEEILKLEESYETNVDTSENEEEMGLESSDVDYSSWDEPPVKPDLENVDALNEEEVQVEDPLESLSLNNDEEAEGFGQEKFNFKVIRGPDDLVKFIQELKETANKKSKKDGAASDAATFEGTPSADTSQEKQNQELHDGEEGEGSDAEDAALINEFEKELQDVHLPKSEISRIQHDVKAQMEKEFDNIIDEAQEELQAEGLKGEYDRNQASKSLASTLNRLIDKLDKKEVDNREEEEEDPTRGSPGRLPKQRSDGDTENRVKIRVTRIKPGSALQKEMKVREMSGEEPHLRQIEKVVKEQLEKSGLKAEGKIEVKIITTGSFGDEEDFHWLSDEETKSFKELLINLLTGGTEEAYKERQRQQRMEDNYRFVWGKNQEEAQSASSTDSDEMDF